MLSVIDSTTIECARELLSDSSYSSIVFFLVCVCVVSAVFIQTLTDFYNFGISHALNLILCPFFVLVFIQSFVCPYFVCVLLFAFIVFLCHTLCDVALYISSFLVHIWVYLLLGVGCSGVYTQSNGLFV